MKSKRLLAALAAAMMLVAAGCSSGNNTPPAAAGNENPGTETPAEGGDSDSAEPEGGHTGKVVIWASGSDNIRIAYEMLTEAFNNDPDYGSRATAELQFIATGGGGQMIQEKILAAYKAGQQNTEYDLIDSGDEQISSFLSEGGPDMFMKYDASKIPNLANVEARPAEGEEYFMPYRGTTVVMAYNSEAVADPPKTVDELTAWIAENPGRFAYNAAGTGGAGDSFVRSSIYNFLPDEAFMSNDPAYMEQWDEGFAYLASIHPNLYQSGGRVVYPNKNQGTLDLLASKEIDMCPAWADQAISSVKNGTLPESIKIYQLEPSLTGAVQTLGIPSFASNVEGAYAFMDFMLSPKAQGMLLEEIAAIPLIDISTLESDMADSVGDLDVSNFRTQSIGELYIELNQRWDNEIATLS